MKAMVPRERLLTARELAGLLGVCVETIARWRRKRGLPAIRLPGGHYRYRLSDVRAFLNGTV